MLGRRAKPGGVRATEQRKIASDHSRHTGAAISSPPKLFLASSSSMSGEAASPEPAEAVASPTSTLQAAAAASPTSPATTCHGTALHAIPFSRRHGSSGGGVDRHRTKSRRPWEAARPVGLGLAGALNGETTGAATTVLVTGRQSLRPVQLQNTDAPPRSPSSSPAAVCTREFGVKSCRSHGSAGRSAAAQSSSPRRLLSPGEMEASEDYTRVIARGPNPRTTHIFDDRVVVDGGGFTAAAAGSGGDEFLRWCHGCSKDLGQGKDIFMYRGEMAFCSHECRYREMLFDEEL